MNGDRERCIQAGMNAYISKPVQPAHLIAMIEKQLAGAASTPPAPATNQLERVLTDRLMQQDSGLMNDMLQLFLQLAPERLEKLEMAAARSDAVTLTQEARMIRAAAAQIASGSLGECAESIERAAARRDFDQVKLDLETLRLEIRSIEALTT